MAAHFGDLSAQHYALDLGKVKRIVVPNQPNAVRPGVLSTEPAPVPTTRKNLTEVGHALVRKSADALTDNSGFHLPNTAFWGGSHEALFEYYHPSIFSDMDAVDRLGLERRPHRFAKTRGSRREYPDAAVHVGCECHMECG